MSDVTMIYSDERNTWNVIVDNEWYYEGDYEECCKIVDNFYLCDLTLDLPCDYDNYF